MEGHAAFAWTWQDLASVAREKSNIIGKFKCAPPPTYNGASHALVGGIVSGLGIMFSGGAGSNGLIDAMRLGGMVLGPLVGIIWFVQLFALGSVLSLLVDIEENTRSLAEQPTAAPVDLA